MSTRSVLAPALLGAALLAAACGGASSSAEPAPVDAVGGAAGGAAGTCLVGTPDCVDADLGGSGAPSAGMCAPGVTDCVDAVLEPGEPADVPSAATAEDARALLGLAEVDLPADVRVARRGAEQLMLTEDYVVGRRTVELDDDGSGMRVVSVTVELADGPRTFDLQAG